MPVTVVTVTQTMECTGTPTMLSVRRSEFTLEGNTRTCSSFILLVLALLAICLLW
ncbi:hypothetical protein BJX63DRAFT_416670 [Aspergillus granulosus]|uniref:Uncharacterized protein n=1 Tax=Aspergillus granulosus TaxID=176169 RepID=A0ABR4GRQ5_9EURO